MKSLFIIFSCLTVIAESHVSNTGFDIKEQWRFHYRSEPASFGRKFEPVYQQHRANLFQVPDLENDPFLCADFSELGRKQSYRSLRSDNLSMIVEEEKNGERREANEQPSKEALSIKRQAEGLNDVNYPIAILVQNGGCDFYQKARNALKLNEIYHSLPDSDGSIRIEYLIVYNNITGSNELIKMDGPEDSSIDIGLIFVSTTDGRDMQLKMDKWSVFNRFDNSENKHISPRLNEYAFMSKGDEDRNTWFFPVLVSGQTEPMGDEGDEESWLEYALISIFFVVLSIIRLIFLWLVSGGRVRLRRNEQGWITGVEYISPRPNWFRGIPENFLRTIRPKVKEEHKLTELEVMSLPEVTYGEIESYDIGNTTTSYEKDSYRTKEREKKNDPTTESRNAQTETFHEEMITESIPGDSIEAGHYADSASRNTEDKNDLSIQSKNMGNLVAKSGIDLEQTKSCTDGSCQRDCSISRSQPCSEFEERSNLSPDNVSFTAENEENIIHMNSSQDSILGTCQAPQNIDSAITVAPIIATSVRQATPIAPSRILSLSKNHIVTKSCTTCSICIDDFEEGEKLRLLPRCGHLFHTDCILPWLTERKACCPLCKRGVLNDIDGEEDTGEDQDGESDTDISSSVAGTNIEDIEMGNTSNIAGSNE